MCGGGRGGRAPGPSCEHGSCASATSRASALRANAARVPGIHAPPCKPDSSSSQTTSSFRCFQCCSAWGVLENVGGRRHVPFRCLPHVRTPTSASALDLADPQSGPQPAGGAAPPPKVLRGYCGAGLWAHTRAAHQWNDQLRGREGGARRRSVCALYSCSHVTTACAAPSPLTNCACLHSTFRCPSTSRCSQRATWRPGWARWSGA